MAIDALKEETHIVFISGLNLYKCPEIVQEAIASDEATGPTPILVVFDPKLEKRLGVIPYYDTKDVDGFKAVKGELAKMRGVTAKSSLAKMHSVETWKDTRGRTMKATYLRSTEDKVTFRLSGGNLSTIAISKLSEASQKRITEIAAGE